MPQQHSEELSALTALTSLRRLSLSYYALDNRLMRALGAALPRLHTLLMERSTVAARPSEGVDESSTLADTSLQMFDGLTRFTALAHLSLAACNLVVNSECGALEVGQSNVDSFDPPQTGWRLHLRHGCALYREVDSPAKPLDVRVRVARPKWTSSWDWSQTTASRLLCEL